mmetsp:Transcript_10875/g.24632  ORF Transcript_10875/g.24632 Transcript_10875/m.24632 type:complete len:186 (-) Transcript_10875:32-589(-)|eukprot:CAMPEP_0197930248 /NCGR_PEP_ID=MMETSP1439-20131203/105165_1 /TAXON_ID=66791 /ORGANISM="Gonyaulax spinifera, Strain CCMP409" /LENGTH=185 /DNA_ID=CAMNT_0043552937 /DNA_START=154 /DNA_END=711 /DNA_ORIENTATION=+
MSLPDSDPCDCSLASLSEVDLTVGAKAPDGKAQQSAGQGSRPDGIVVAQRPPTDYEASLHSLSQLDIGETPEPRSADDRPAVDKDKGWDLQVEDAGAKKEAQPARKWWKPRLGSQFTTAKASNGEEKTEVSAFEEPKSPAAQERGWDLEVDPAKGGPSALRIGIGPASHIEATQVCTFTDLPESP